MTEGEREKLDHTPRDCFLPTAERNDRKEKYVASEKDLLTLDFS